MTVFIAGLFFSWRILLFAAAYLAEKIMPFTPRFPYADLFLIPSNLPRWIWGFANFDGVHYLTIASRGYQAQYTQVYFPLFPAILKYFYRLLPVFHPLVSGLLLSNVLFLASLFLLSAILRPDIQENRLKWILAFLVFFPTSYYFGSLYTESLFLFLLLLSFWLAKKKKWFLASLAGAAASGTRLIGIFLLPALLWQYMDGKKKSTLLHFLKSPVLYLAPLGLIAYMSYLYYYFSDALYFWHAQPVFGAARSGSSLIFMPQVVYRYIKMFADIPVSQEVFWITFLEFYLTLFTIFLLLVARRQKIYLSWLIFAWPAIILPTLTGTFSSMPRYVLVALPIFLVLASIRNLKIRSLVLFISLLLQLVLTMLFTSGHWVA
ncbi:MAG: hypothetical protein UV73_C0001G0151 [Candidatus Gottesmanbacteria bacterium GW2011_GWA2_43_14]|uniref:Glycosyltransferase RgtA/B/C/D-like domain-containing protein n=1 Tax=Candidatus Gottesmanbacteria bacterium GW2011_GWA2_43_14 TaxID=1618443 RepID=A0A0G1DLB8_9BACT|nr:MAG: hypothetical protein UV73_C0001G0151 [Candidatus Gottesmanbacteria bacterium GW2011_GWA2_43_14]